MTTAHIGKSEFIDQIQDKLSEGSNMSFTKEAISSILDAVSSLIVENAKNGTEIRIKNFGTFKPQTMAAKTGRNPKTGEAVSVPSRTKISFKMSGSLKEVLNQSN